jgi:hypothetical protein
MGLRFIKPIHLRERLFLVLTYTLAVTVIFSFSLKQGFSTIGDNFLTFLGGAALAVLSMSFNLPFWTWLLVGGGLTVGIYGYSMIFWYLLSIIPFLLFWKFLDSRLLKSQLLKYSIVVGLVAILAKSTFMYSEYESIQYEKSHPNEKMPD